MAQASLFDQTAENRARNKTILWWVLNLAHEQEGDNYTKVFSGESYEEMIASYDRYEEEEDDFVDEMLKKFSYVVSFWFVTKAETQEQLNVLLSTADDDVMGLKAEESAEEVKEEVKEEDKKAEKKSKERPVKKAGSTKKTKVEESGVKKSKVEKEG